jgi:cell filamentation protein
MKNFNVDFDSPKDTYVYNNGTLKNKLHIKNEERLARAEADIGFSKLINVNTAFLKRYDPEFIRNLHKHIFSDIYSWAGKYRTIPMEKEEIVLPKRSVNYSAPENIEEDLKRELNVLNKSDWTGKDNDQISLEFARKLGRLWKVHPFRDGNTRTTLAFADIYARAHGFPMNMGFMLDKLVRKYEIKDGKKELTQLGIRDYFVLASLDDDWCPEPEGLAKILKQAIEIGPRGLYTPTDPRSSYEDYDENHDEDDYGEK